MTEQASVERAKHAFLSHMRHELRTPCNAIIGYSEMLLEDEGDGPLKEDLTKIHSSGKTLLGLINELLDPAKLQGVIDGAHISAFGAQMRHELRTPVNTVIGYAEMLVEDESSLEPRVVEDLRKIHAAGKKLLAFVDDIINLSKVASGNVDAALESSGLATIIKDVVTTIKPLQAEAVKRADHPGGRLLVVDDNDVNRDMLCRRLQREGYAAEAAEDGLQALQLLKEESFDLVLLDIMMPVLNGYQVLERLKADPNLRHIPVIMISALDEIDSVVRCIEIGAEDYLPKPFDPIILKARLGACLEKKRLRDREVMYLRQIEEEKKKSDELLHVILPHEIVEELKSTNAVRPRRHDEVAVLFCDIVGFTPFCATREPDEIVKYLQDLIVAYEEVALRHQVLKIKTIGDSFMGACGLITSVANPSLNAVRCGLEMLETVHRMPAGWDVRVGIHVGPVTAGVVGHRTYLFDLWGDTVNTAARVESHGKNGSVNVSAEVWDKVKGQCRGESMGVIKVKGKGEMEIHRVDGLMGA
jgi:CheY-like chemotaxis protein/class 3 adenylate cyclase